MSGQNNATVECMADRFMSEYEREYAAGITRQRETVVPVILAALLKEVRGLRADIASFNRAVAPVHIEL